MSVMHVAAKGGRSGMVGATPVPGPKGGPLFGVARELRRDLFGMLLEGFRRYGDLVLYRAGPARGPSWMRRDTVAVFHPDGVRQVLSDEQVFTRRTASLGVLGELFGENLVTTTGQVWRRQKRTLQPLFTPRHVERYAALMRVEARTVCDQAFLPDRDVDLAKVMERYALKILGRTLFQDVRGIDDDTVAALGRLVPVVGGLVQSRAVQVVRLPLAWPTARNRRFVKTRAELYSIVERVLAGRAGRRAAIDGADDLLGRLQQAREPGTGKPLSAQEVRDQALIFLIAGHTTTSNALASTLHLLARNPEIQAQVAESAVIPATPDGDLVLAAVQEGLRLCPPSYAIGRRVLTDTEIDGHAISAGTNVLVSPWITHRHPEFWPQPERFDPMRFVGRHQRAQYAYFPFGGGARSCIGRHFAMLEATIVVREILSAYKLVALDGDIPRAQQLSLRPSGPVRVRCQRR